MSANLVDLNQSWVDRVLYPSSIPHLFHHDLQLLWILKKPTDLRPRTSQGLVEAWRKLVSHLLLGQLRGEEHTFTPPFSTFTARYGLPGVRVFSHDGTPVAVSSPAVLIRPLPDTNLAELCARLADPFADDRRQRATVLLRTLKNSLDAAGGHAQEFGNLMAREFALVDAAQQQGLRTSLISIPLWKRADASLFLDRPETVAVEISIYADAGRLEYVPRCNSCKNHLLGKASSEPHVVAPGATTVSLRCACGNDTAVDLAKFFVWNRSAGPIAWRDRGSLVTGDQELPPIPRTSGNQLIFEWDSTSVAGENRFLSFTFGEPCKIMHVRDIFYKRFLVLDATPSLPCAPVKADMEDAIASFPVARPSAGGGIDLVGLKLQGIQYELSLRFQANEVDVHPGTGLWMFPRRLPSYWKRYRFGLSANAGDLRVVSGSRQGIQVDVRDGIPRHLSIERTDASAGLMVRLPEAAPSAQGATPVLMALDFGTSSSVVAFVQDNERSYLEPLQLLQSAETLIGSSQTSPPFLPPSGFKAGEEVAAVPSALWTGAEGGLSSIRWSSALPWQGARASEGFKWDRSGARRGAYLDELVFLALAHRVVSISTETRPNLVLAVAFPLAFDHERRKALKEDLDGLKSSVENWFVDPTTASPTSVSLLTVNESIAAARSHGGLNPGETVLVADLGGGSLDLALFTRGERPSEFSFHQVGSVHLGGELFIRRVSREIGGDVQDERRNWSIRDSVSAATVGRDFPANLPSFSRAAAVFLPLALEIVRQAALAHMAVTPKQSIKLHLAGSGWQTARFRQTAGSRADAEVHLREYASQFDLKDLNIGSLVDPRVPPKRVVSEGLLGLLKTSDLKNELNREVPDPTKMVSGRAITISSPSSGKSQDLPWHHLVGPGAQAATSVVADLHNAQVFLESAGSSTAPVSSSWATVFDSAINSLGLADAFPSEAKMLAALQESFAGTRFGMGPLQIAAERHWGPEL